MKYFTACAMFFVIYLGSTCAAELVNRIVAVVGDEIITMDELLSVTRFEEDRIMRTYIGSRQREELFGMRKKYLDNMITERIIRKEVQRQGIEIPDDRIDRNIKLWREQVGMTEHQLGEWLQNQGLTMDTYRDILRSQLELQVLLTRLDKQIVVTQTEIKEYFNRHIEEFIPGNRVHLRTILIHANPEGPGLSEAKRLQAEEALRRVRQGTSFEQVAMQVSEGPNALSGGDISWIEWEHLDSDLQAVIGEMTPGDTSDILVLDRGAEKWFQIIQLVDREIPGEPSIERAAPRIVKILTDRKIEERKEEWLKKLRENYFVKVKL